MTRPLTLMDRAPEKGDRLRHPEWLGEIVVPTLFDDSTPAALTNKTLVCLCGITVRAADVYYTKRADGGPVTVEVSR